MALLPSTSVTISIIVDPPRAMPCALEPNCVKRGLAFDIADLVCRTLKYNCTFVLANTDVYGFFDNGSWHGVLGDIIEGRVDAAMPSFAFTPQRLEVVDFSGVYHYENYILLTRRDASRYPNLNFFDAFDLNVWILIACLLILAGFVIPDTIFFTKKISFLEELVIKWLNVPVPFLVREILICTLALVCLVLTQSYTGYLFSEKVAAPSRLPFTDMDTFVDCVEKKKCTLVLSTSYVSVIKQSLGASNGSVLMSRLKTVYDNSPFKAYSLEELMNVVLFDDGKTYRVGLMTDTDFFYAAKFEDQCKYYKYTPPQGVFPPSTNSFPIRKNSPIGEDLDVMASRFLDYAFLKNILSKYMSTENDCVESHTVSRPDTLAFLSGVFYFLGVAEGFACIYFLLERLYFRMYGQNTFRFFFWR